LHDAVDKSLFYFAYSDLVGWYFRYCRGSGLHRFVRQNEFLSTIDAYAQSIHCNPYRLLIDIHNLSTLKQYRFAAIILFRLGADTPRFW